ncbi:MAG: hypothetical protein ACHP7J_00100 [Terriglobales bacterium]
MTLPEAEAEIRRLHHFTLRLAERLFLAAECLSRVAEKREPERKKPKNRKPARRSFVKKRS